MCGMWGSNESKRARLADPVKHEQSDGSQTSSKSGSCHTYPATPIKHAPPPVAVAAPVKPAIDVTKAFQCLYDDSSETGIGRSIEELFPGVLPGLPLWEKIIEVYSKQRNATIPYYDIGGREQLVGRPRPWRWGQRPRVGG